METVSSHVILSLPTRGILNRQPALEFSQSLSNALRDLDTLLGTQTALTNSLEIKPGDSAAIVAAKIRAFTFATVLEIFDNLPTEAPIREQLKTALQTSRSFVSESKKEIFDGINTPNKVNTSHRQNQNEGSSLRVSTQPHQLEGASLLSLRELFTANLANSIAAFPNDFAARDDRTVKFQALVREISSLFESPSQSNFYEKIDSKELRNLVRGLIDESAHGDASLIKFNAPEWKQLLAVLKVIDFIELGLGENSNGEEQLTTNSLGTSSRSSRANFNLSPQNPVKTSSQYKSEFELNSDAREIFFSTAPLNNSSASSSSALEPKFATGAPLLTPLLAQIVASPTGPTAGSINQAALNAMVGILASRLVVAYRLAPQQSRIGSLPPKRMYQKQRELNADVWTLIFRSHPELNETVQVSVALRHRSKDGEAQPSMEIGINESETASQQRTETENEELLSLARTVSARLGLNRIDWRTTPMP